MPACLGFCDGTHGYSSIVLRGWEVGRQVGGPQTSDGPLLGCIDADCNVPKAHFEALAEMYTQYITVQFILQISIFECYGLINFWGRVTYLFPTFLFEQFAITLEKAFTCDENAVWG